MSRPDPAVSYACSARDYFRAFTDTVEKTFPALEYAFAAPDLAAGLRSGVLEPPAARQP